MNDRQITKYEDDNIILEFYNKGRGLANFTTEMILSYRNNPKNVYAPRLEFKNKFLERLYDNYSEQRWVDIEMNYYNELKILLKGQPSRLDKALQLQRDFGNLTELFRRYIKDCVISLEYKQLKGFEEFFSSLNKSDIVINFNYTDTPYIYRSRFIRPEADYQIINIHGKVSDSSDDSIIFGFGDETDTFYGHIENLNDNRLFDHIKSFSYLKNNRYHQLEASIEAEEGFDVHIFGMSCGISDRVLLSYIFNRAKNIHIHYYKGYKNYRQIFMEVSRHFNDKIAMRCKVRNFAECFPCPQIDD